MSEWKRLKNLDPDCFACGRENRHGLKMTFETNGERLRSRVAIPGHLRGWSDLVHGGVLATLLDECMGWTCIVLTRRFILTREMTVRFRRPVRIGTEVLVEGRIAGKTDERNRIMKAVVRTPDGEICAEGEGAFVLFTKEEFKRLDLMPESLLDEMDGRFGEME